MTTRVINQERNYTSSSNAANILSTAGENFHIILAQDIKGQGHYCNQASQSHGMIKRNAQ